MFVPEIINKKKEGLKLSKAEIDFLISGYTKGDIPDYQLSAFCMALCFKGMDKDETAWLTEAMMHSGDVLDLSAIKGIKVDKHSTGGVGDKTSLVLGPLVASCGAKVSKLSGRGLGHTGGTIDKLESIPGTSIALSNEKFIEQINKIGIAIAGQTSNLDPADKKLYALRDVTATVNCVPLIASSIMSKKLATGSDCVLLDVKYGSGAFCKTKKEARILARTMVDIGKSMNKDVKAIISNMNQPLGCAIGNSLEVIEAVKTLNGEGPADLTELCIKSAAIMLCQAKIFENENVARNSVENSILNKSGFNKLKEFISAQGGDASYLDNPDKFEKAKIIKDVISEKDCYVKSIDTITLGEIACKLGAGRATKEDKIDFAAGIMVYKKPGDKVLKGEKIATIFTNHSEYENEYELLKTAFKYSKFKTKHLKLIEEIIK